MAGAEPALGGVRTGSSESESSVTEAGDGVTGCCQAGLRGKVRTHRPKRTRATGPGPGGSWPNDVVARGVSCGQGDRADGSGDGGPLFEPKVECQAFERPKLLPSSISFNNYVKFAIACPRSEGCALVLGHSCCASTVCVLILTITQSDTPHVYKGLPATHTLTCQAGLHTRKTLQKLCLPAQLGLRIH